MHTKDHFYIAFYFHSLKPLDISVMKCLHDKVNIVPVIAKADTLTKKEVKDLKQRILREIYDNHIQIYQFPEADEEEDDEEFIAVNKELKVRRPKMFFLFHFVSLFQVRIQEKKFPVSRFYPMSPRFFTTFPDFSLIKFFKVCKCERYGSRNPRLYLFIFIYF